MNVVLALDTSTEACSVALAMGTDVLERFEVAGREHSRRLLPMIHSVLGDAGIGAAAIDGIVCGHGPGSFAGVRIGVGTAKGLALAHDRPVVGVSSLAMLALGAVPAGQSARVAAVIDARMNEVYCGLFEIAAGELKVLGPERVCAPDAVPDLPPGDWLGAGSGWARYGEALRSAFGQRDIAADETALPRASAALQLGRMELAAGRGVKADELVPVYLRNRVALTLDEQAALRRSDGEKR